MVDKVLVGSGEFWKALEGYGWPWPALGGFVRFQFLPDMSKKKFAEIPQMIANQNCIFFWYEKAPIRALFRHNLQGGTCWPAGWLVW